MRVKALILFTLLLSVAHAADTTEPFELGLSDAEMYLSLGDLGGPAGKALGFTGVLGAGLTERLSLTFAWSAEGDDDLRLGGRAQAGGLFYNALNSEHFDLDGFVGIEGAAEGLGLNPGVELNFDSADDHSGWGAYLRLDLALNPKDPAPADGGNDAPVATDDGPLKALGFNPGVYLTLSENDQLLLEHQHGFELGEGFEGAGRFSLGYNRAFEDIELISEVGYQEEIFDLSIGFIATLPTGK